MDENNIHQKSLVGTVFHEKYLYLFSMNMKNLIPWYKLTNNIEVKAKGSK